MMDQKLGPDRSEPEPFPEALIQNIDAQLAKRKASYVGAPACFALDIACRLLNEAFHEDGYGCYLVGSATSRADWRDIDVVAILSDDAFESLFPDAHVQQGSFEHDPRWLVLTVALSKWLSEQSGLPVDFKFQPQTWANARHDGPRHALGMRMVPKRQQSAP
jgi:hypothetical protein